MRLVLFLERLVLNQMDGWATKKKTKKGKKSFSVSNQTNFSVQEESGTITINLNGQSASSTFSAILKSVVVFSEYDVTVNSIDTTLAIDPGNFLLCAEMFEICTTRRPLTSRILSVQTVQAMKYFWDSRVAITLWKRLEVWWKKVWHFLNNVMPFQKETL